MQVVISEAEAAYVVRQRIELHAEHESHEAAYLGIQHTLRASYTTKYTI